MDVDKKTGPRWMKAEMHSHCSLDPVDYRVCDYSPEELISETARLGYEVLSITCHNLDVWSKELSEYARSLGVTLVPGMEVDTEGRRHALLYNFKTTAENLDTLEKIRAHSNKDTLIVAPHPYFPGSIALRELLDCNVGMFDAIEVSGFYTPLLDFNRKARRLATQHGKPMVGNADVHQLWQLGKTFTWIYAEPEVGSIMRAIQNGHVRVESTTLTFRQVVSWWARTLWCHVFPVQREPARRLVQSDQQPISGTDQRQHQFPFN